MWFVCEIDDESNTFAERFTVSAIPESWTFMRNMVLRCFWPKTKNPSIKIKSAEIPNEENGKWTSYKCRVLMNAEKFSTYQAAKNAEKIGQNDSIMTNNISNKAHKRKNENFESNKISCHVGDKWVTQGDEIFKNKKKRRKPTAGQWMTTNVCDIASDNVVVETKNRQSANMYEVEKHLDGHAEWVVTGDKNRSTIRKPTSGQWMIKNVCHIASDNVLDDTDDDCDELIPYNTSCFDEGVGKAKQNVEPRSENKVYETVHVDVDTRDNAVDETKTKHSANAHEDHKHSDGHAKWVVNGEKNKIKIKKPTWMLSDVSLALDNDTDHDTYVIDKLIPYNTSCFEDEGTAKTKEHVERCNQNNFKNTFIVDTRDNATDEKNAETEQLNKNCANVNYRNVEIENFNESEIIDSVEFNLDVGTALTSTRVESIDSENDRKILAEIENIRKDMTSFFYGARLRLDYLNNLLSEKTTTLSTPNSQSPELETVRTEETNTHAHLESAKEVVKPISGQETLAKEPIDSGIKVPVISCKQFHSSENDLENSETKFAFVRYLFRVYEGEQEAKFMKTMIETIFEKTFFIEKLSWKKESNRVLLKDSLILECWKECYERKFGLYKDDRFFMAHCRRYKNAINSRKRYKKKK